ncbi:MAG: hypothetical protein JJ855_08525 [Rhodospirillales bacterium]|nr:hypothetical protein [Rhodospirillales bacterium]
MFGRSADVFDRVVGSDEIALDDIAYLPIMAAYRYWDEQRGGNFAPPRRSFRLEELPPRLIPYMAMIDFLGPPLDFYYRFFGGAMAEVSGRELTGKTYYADKIEGYGFVNARLFPILIERKTPMVHRTTWESVRGLRLVTVTLRLPLSNDGMNVDGAVTANSYEIDRTSVRPA